MRDQLKGVLQIQSTADAFAAILADGSVVAWGDETHGGDGSMYRQDRLKGVVQIQATSMVFAAIMADGSAVVWPDKYLEVPYPLKGIRQIQSTADAFAAILGDGSVVTWGDAEDGGDSSAVRDQLRSVRQIQATMYGALKMDPSLPGVTRSLAVTVRQFEISSRALRRLKVLLGPLLRYWKMDLSLAGVTNCTAGTAQQFKISSKVCRTFK